MAQDQPTLEGLTADVKFTSERLAQLEGAQIVAEERLKAIEDAQGVANTQLQDILLRLDELRTTPLINNNVVPHNSMGVAATSRARRVPMGHPQHPATATDAATINQHPQIPPRVHKRHGDNYEDNSGDTKDDQMVNHHNDCVHRQLRFNRQGMAQGPHRYEFEIMTTLVLKLNLLCDAEHPTFIPMYTPTTLRAPRGHMTRPRAYAIGHKVNSILSKPSLSSRETWLLLQAPTLCILRYT